MKGGLEVTGTTNDKTTWNKYPLHVFENRGKKATKNPFGN